MRPSESVPGVGAPSYAARGTHWLVDCYGVEPGRLADAAWLEALLCAAAEEAGAHRLFRHFHRFGDAAQAGVTGVVLLAESHITIHTWPEQRFAAIDLFLCGATRPELALVRIERELAAEQVVVSRQVRGEALRVPAEDVRTRASLG